MMEVGMASEVDQLVRSIADRRRAARIRGVAAGVAYGLACAIAFAIVKPRAESTLGDILVLLLQSALVASAWVGYVVYARAASSGEVLVWLRKFWPSRGRRMRFASMLGQASAGVTYPVTLQDDSFPTSYYRGGLRLWVLAPVLLFAWVAGLLLMSLFAFAGIGSRMADSALLFVLIVLYTVGFVSLVMNRLKHFGLRTLKADSAAREITGSLDKARRGRRYLGWGVEVFKCPRKPEDLWHEVVIAALKRASIVVIDVTNFKDSEPIQWELGQALSLHDPRDIIVSGQNVIWVLTPSGLARADPATGTITAIIRTGFASSALSAPALIMDAAGRLWITGSRLSVLLPGTLATHLVARTPSLISAAADGPAIWLDTGSALARLQLGTSHATGSKTPLDR
jgi:hypothetical protein